MARLLRQHRNNATVHDQARFYDRSEHVVLPSAPLRVLLARIGERLPYGKTPQ